MIVRRPGFIEPCLPSKVVRPPTGPLWVHEIKHDGYRLMVGRDGCHRGGTKKKPPLKVGQRRLILSKVQPLDQRMRLGMRCRLSPTADVQSHTSGQRCASVRH